MDKIVVTAQDALAIVVTQFADIAGLIEYAIEEQPLLLNQIYEATEEIMLNKMLQCAQDGDIEAVIVYGNRIKDIQSINELAKEYL